MERVVQLGSRAEVSPRRAVAARPATNGRTRAVVRNCLADTLAVDLVRTDEVAVALHYKVSQMWLTGVYILVLVVRQGSNTDMLSACHASGSLEYDDMESAKASGKEKG